MIGLTSVFLAVTLDSLSPSSRDLVFIPGTVAAKISGWVEHISCIANTKICTGGSYESPATKATSTFVKV